MQKIKEYLKKHYIVSSVIGLAVFFFLIYLIFGGKEEFPYDTVVVEKGDVVQEVSVTGSIKPAQDVNLAFEKGGKISRVYVEVSDRVYSGKTLVQLDNGDIWAQLQGAKADLKSQQAKLDELKRGTREEEIGIQETKVVSAEVAVEDAKQNLLDKLNDAYTKSDDAIRNKTDQFFSNPRGASPSLIFSNSPSGIDYQVESDRILVEEILTNWQTDDFILSLESDLLSFTSEAKTNLDTTKAFLEKTALVINSLTSSSALSQTTIDGWKSAVSTARTNVNTAIVNLSAAEEELKTDNSALVLAEQELELKKAGTVAEQVLAQEAKVESAQAAVRNYEAQLSKTIIRSPIKGIVTKQEAKVGEIVPANQLMVAVISDANFEIEADIPEVDVAKLELEDVARVTLDAYGDDIVFEVVVVAIDPAETLIEGVPSYKTTFQFKEKDERIRSGMTANLDILTDKKEGVIAVPQRAVITKGGIKFVRIVKGGNIEEVEVKTGLKGSFGEIEILEGINEGDEVVTFMR